jgi:hypothetical protein
MLDVTKEVKNLFENFKPKLPLINDIRNPALKYYQFFYTYDLLIINNYYI